MISIAHRIELKPNNKQKTYFRKAFGCARLAYNWGLAEWKRMYEAGEKPSGREIRKRFNAIKKEQFPFVYEVTKCATEQPFDYLQKAFDKFFRDLKQGKVSYPQFKKKRDNEGSFYIEADKIRLSETNKNSKAFSKLTHNENGKHQYICMPKMHGGWVKMAEHIRFNYAKINNVCISQSGGKCIWCGRTKEDGASFDHVPHILPKALGGQETCTDVCNECNSFFGDDRSKYGISQDEAVKGILQVGKHYFSMNPQQEKSPIFNYFVSKHKISLKRNLHVTAQGLTRQFKRGMCECFLQKYHYLTNDGNSPLFEKLRRFARYDEGDIPFYCVINKILIGFIDEKKPIFGMSKSDIDNVRRCGIFICRIFGHVIIMDVIPNAPHIEKMRFCDDLSNLVIMKGNTLSIARLDSISQLDLLYTRYNHFQSAAISDSEAYMPFLEEPQ